MADWIVEFDLSGESYGAFSTSFPHWCMECLENFVGDIKVTPIGDTTGGSGEVEFGWVSEDGSEHGELATVSVESGQSEIVIEDIEMEAGSFYYIGHDNYDSNRYASSHVPGPEGTFIQVVHANSAKTNLMSSHSSRTYGFESISLRSEDFAYEPSGTWQSPAYDTSMIEDVEESEMAWNQDLPAGTSATVYTAVTDVSVAPVEGDWVEQAHVVIPEETFEATSEGKDGDLQTYTVQETGTVTLKAWGAQGGERSGYDHGLGAYMQGEFDLEAGDELLILVGQRGEDAPGTGGAGGGGGTFICKVSDSSDPDAFEMDSGVWVVPLLVAGGGMGAPNSGTSANPHGRTDTRGHDHVSVGHGNNSGGGGGGSWSVHGGGNTAHRGYSFLSGGQGGDGSWAYGGFGCGGSKGDSYNDGAGGGGFDGGDHSYEDDLGGGGSYCSGTLTEGDEGVREGHGLAEIIEVYDPTDPEYDPSIRSLTVGQDLSTKEFHVKVELATTDVEETPSIGDMYFWIRDPIDDLLVMITMEPLNAPEEPTAESGMGGRFNNVTTFSDDMSLAGEMTVAYDVSLGNLEGTAGPVESFSETFTPTDLVAMPDVGLQDHVVSDLTDLVVDFKEVDYLAAYGDELLVPTISALTVTFTHVDDLDP